MCLPYLTVCIQLFSMCEFVIQIIPSEDQDMI